MDERQRRRALLEQQLLHARLRLRSPHRRRAGDPRLRGLAPRGRHPLEHRTTSSSGRTDPVAQQDGELIARVAAHDREAFEALFHRYYRHVFAFVDRRLSDGNLSEETVMDTFFEVWRSAASFRAESRPSSWIFGIAHFKAIAAIRSRSRGKRSAVVPVPDEDLRRAPAERSLEEQLEARNEIRRVREVVGSLADAQRETAELVWLEGLSYDEAADRLGISVDSVKTRLWRARRRMREELRPGERA